MRRALGRWAPPPNRRLVETASDHAHVAIDTSLIENSRGMRRAPGRWARAPPPSRRLVEADRSNAIDTSQPWDAARAGAMGAASESKAR